MNAERSQDQSLVKDPGSVEAKLHPAPDEEYHVRPRHPSHPSRRVPKWLSVLLTTLGACVAAVLVIAAAVAIVVPRMISKVDQAKMAAAKQDETTLVNELDVFRLDCGRYPTAKEGLDALESPPPGLQNVWKGPYQPDRIPNDPWGHPYVYRVNKDHTISITSYGSDGQPGGEASTSETDITKRID